MNDPEIVVPQCNVLLLGFAIRGYACKLVEGILQQALIYLAPFFESIPFFLLVFGSQEEGN